MRLLPNSAISTLFTWILCTDLIRIFITILLKWRIFIHHFRFGAPSIAQRFITKTSIYTSWALNNPICCAQTFVFTIFLVLAIILRPLKGRILHLLLLNIVLINIIWAQKGLSNPIITHKRLSPAIIGFTIFWF